MFNTQFIQEYLVLHGGILSAHLLGCILVLAQALRGVHLGRKGVLFHLPIYPSSG